MKMFHMLHKDNLKPIVNSITKNIIWFQDPMQDNDSLQSSEILPDHELDEDIPSNELESDHAVTDRLCHAKLIKKKK